MTALAHSLQKRGHQVVMFGVADTEDRVRAAGIEFCKIGDQDFPRGTLLKLDRRMAQLKGLAALRFTLQRIRDSARMVMRDGPEAVRAANIDALLVDEAEFAGSVADYLGLPWISIALIPPLVHDDRFPPFWFGWPAGQDRLSRFRNVLAMSALLRVSTAIFTETNQWRRDAGMEPFLRPQDWLSPLAQIAQLPKALEFKVEGEYPEGLHYTGPFVHAHQRPAIAFPWELLDGRPLIYASLGTLQNGLDAIFRTIARACDGLDAQLVISLGGGLKREDLGDLAGNPLVVSFAPQLQILQRAALVITHAGINTVLESLSEGVPMVAIPLGNDQPGMAARIKAQGAGVVVSRRTLTVARLRGAIVEVLHSPQYRHAARKLQVAIQQLNGPDTAAAIIESALPTHARQCAD
jgi:MGT family glycosyltransferase